MPIQQSSGMSRLDIICFANDWTADPTSKHHLMRRVAETNRVLWVESAGMRAPQLSRQGDLRRIARKARSLMRTPRQVTPNLHVYAPPVVPFPERRLARAANRVLYRTSIMGQLARLGWSHDPVIWSFTPHVAPLIRGMRPRLLIYHCVDRWSAFEDYNAALMDEWERELCQRADLVFASAEHLVEHCEQYSDNVHYIPHGVDVTHFGRGLEPGGLPPDLEGIPEPRIGFFGLLHEWVDTDLLEELADRLPYSFVLIGDSKVPLVALTERPNVHHLGRRPYDTLPDYCRGFHAGVIPFRRSELTRSVNPIKLREYAAAGLPVVSTDLPEVQRCLDIAVTAGDVDAWVRALKDAVRRGGDPEERRAQNRRVADQDWSNIVETIGSLVAAELACAE
jgi:glycosyltransferase involved in cell wall biosynthesis